jgi:type II secretory pathway pseudopilin PulG
MFHIAIDGVKQGPLNEAEVREKIARGELRAGDLCWTEGWTEWKRIDVVFPASVGVVPPPLAPHLGAANPFTGTPKRCGLAVVSLVCGICTIVLFPLFFVFMIPAIVCGHVAQSRIKQAKGALVGGGMALAGLIMGYLGIAVVPVGGLMAAMAIPAFQKVRTTSITKVMDNDARQLASAAQQYFLENSVTTVAFSYDSATGAVSGPLATYVPQIAKGYTTVPQQITAEGTFELARTSPYLVRSYNADGRCTSDPQYRGN